MKKRHVRSRTLFWGIFFLTLMSAAAVVGALLGYIENEKPVEELEDYAPPESTLVYDSTHQTTLAEFSAERRYLLTYDQIPEQLKLAFMAIEDRRFNEHCGIDPQGIVRAAIYDIKARRLAQGASTITIELAGGVDHDIDRSIKSFQRKFTEALTALQIERRYTKKQILEFYLNQIYLGSGSFGVEAAAQTYFGKSVNELTLAECAMIGGLPQKPSSINPMVNLPASIDRRNMVLQAMLRCGYISQEQFKKAVDEKPKIIKPKQADALYKAPYFVNEYMCESLKDNAQFVELAARAKMTPMEYLKKSGLQVVTTLDLQLQRIAEESVREGLKNAELQWHLNAGKRITENPTLMSTPKVGEERIGEIMSVNEDVVGVEVAGYKAKLVRDEKIPFHDPDAILKTGELLDVKIESVDPQSRTFEASFAPDNKIKGAMVVLEAHTGRVLAMVGGDNYFDKNEKKAEWNFATQGGRQPGSGIKPLFYAAAVKAGFVPNRRFLNVPFDIGNYVGRNYSKNYEGGMMTMQEGIERSQNVMMLRVFTSPDLGMDRALGVVRMFDFAWSRKRWNIPNNQAPVCLGTFDVTPLEMATAYTTFANEGVEIRPYAVDQILNRQGKVIYSTVPERRVMLSPQQAYIMTSMLKGVFGPRGTGADIAAYFEKQKNIPEMAGKTGTTNEVRDAWINGFTPDLVTSTFVGFDPPRPLGGKLTGSTLAGPIYQRFMDEALKTRSNWTMKFTVPPGVTKKIIDLSSGEPVPEWRKSSDPTREAEMWFITTPETAKTAE